MKWNWQQPDWPDFQWERPLMSAAEKQFLLGAGVVIGTVKHLNEGEHDRLIVGVMSGEATATSRIEGEVLDRASVQSSIQRQLGLAAEKRSAGPAEQGIAEMMVDLYKTIFAPLSSKMLFSWQVAMMAGRKDLADIGRYRASPEPMQVVSGAIGHPKVHFEAPPSGRVPMEMRRFVTWFNRTGRRGAAPLPAITRAGIAHLYFESIHPFEDGNGRIGRAIAEKALAQSGGQPVFAGLATAILAHQKAYYDSLEKANKKIEVNAWLKWFSGIALEAQRLTLNQIEFLIAKTRLLDRLRDKLNARQHKALLRMLREGPQGFKGGLSAGNYSKITGASAATTTRDLVDLMAKGALVRTGELRHARYSLYLG